MAKKPISKGQKHSKTNSRPAATEKAATEKKPKAIIIPGETTLRVTYFSQGAFKCTAVGYDKEGKETSRRPVYHSVSETASMCVDAVAFFVSNEGRPRTIGVDAWSKMGKEARVRANIEYSACGRDYSIMFVN